MKTKELVCAFLTLSLLAMASALYAADSKEIIKYRQNIMKTIGANASASAAILQGKVDHKDRLSDHAKTLDTFTKDIAELFPKGSDSGDTRALPSVWKDWGDFEKSAKDTHEKAAAFSKAVASNDGAAIKAAFKDLGESCKSCHKDYRKKKEE
jgi:cytochrome c556